MNGGCCSYAGCSVLDEFGMITQALTHTSSNNEKSGKYQIAFLQFYFLYTHFSIRVLVFNHPSIGPPADDLTSTRENAPARSARQRVATHARPARRG